MDIVINRRRTIITIKDVEHDDIPGMVEEVLLKVDAVQDKREHNKREDYTKQFMNSIYGRLNIEKLKDYQESEINDIHTEAEAIRGSRMIKRIENIPFETRHSAELALLLAEDILGRYTFITIADFLNALDQKASYCDQHWGWSDLSRAEIYIDAKDGKPVYRIRIPGIQHKMG